MTVDTESAWPLVAQVAQLLAARIRSGEYPPGARLPGEWDLAREYHVSRQTVSDALSALHHRDLVLRRNGVGSFVMDSAQPPAQVTVPPGTQVQARLPVDGERAAMGLDRWEFLLAVRRPGTCEDELYPAASTIIITGELPA